MIISNRSWRIAESKIESFPSPLCSSVSPRLKLSLFQPSLYPIPSFHHLDELYGQIDSHSWASCNFKKYPLFPFYFTFALSCFGRALQDSRNFWKQLFEKWVTLCPPKSKCNDNISWFTTKSEIDVPFKRLILLFCSTNIRDAQLYKYLIGIDRKSLKIKNIF